MTIYEIFSVVFSGVSLLIAIGAFIYSIYQGRKANLKRIKKINYPCDENGLKCDSINKCDRLIITFTNIGNRDIKFVFAGIKIGKNTLINSRIIKNEILLSRDNTYTFFPYFSNICNFLYLDKDKIQKNYKLTIIFFDSSNKKYKVKFKFKLFDILEYHEKYNIKENDD